MKTIQELKEIKKSFDNMSDKEQYAWLLNTSLKDEFVIWLDNDDTSIHFKQDENAEAMLTFGDFTGNGMGVFHILEQLGFAVESV